MKRPKLPRPQILGPTAHVPTVRKLVREHTRAMAREERATTLDQSWRLAAASDRVARRLAAARDGITIEAPRTARNLARGAFAALASIGRSIARALTTERALTAARLANAGRKVARSMRLALRRVVTAIVALVASSPALALAHPGHDGHGNVPINGGGVVVLVGVSLGLAAHAWATWGPRRRLVATVDAGDGDPAGGSEPEPEPDVTITRCDGCGAPTHASESDDTDRCAACREAAPTLPDGLARCSCVGDDSRFQIPRADCVACCGVGATPIAPFGRERTVGECRSRAAWERSRASLVESLPQGSLLALAHRRTAQAYEDRARQLEALKDLPSDHYVLTLAAGRIVAGPIHGSGGTIPAGQHLRLQREIDRATDGKRLSIYEPSPGHASMHLPDGSRVEVDLRGARLHYARADRSVRAARAAEVYAERTDYVGFCLDHLITRAEEGAKRARSREAVLRLHRLSDSLANIASR